MHQYSVIPATNARKKIQEMAFNYNHTLQRVINKIVRTNCRMDESTLSIFT